MSKKRLTMWPDGIARIPHPQEVRDPKTGIGWFLLPDVSQHSDSDEPIPDPVQQTLLQSLAYMARHPEMAPTAWKILDQLVADGKARKTATDRGTFYELLVRMVKPRKLRAKRGRHH